MRTPARNYFSQSVAILVHILGLLVCSYSDYVKAEKSTEPLATNYEINGRVSMHGDLNFNLVDWQSLPQDMKWSDYQPVDFNGDGRSDLLVQDAISKVFYAALSNGKDRFSLSQCSGLPSDFPLGQAVVSDFNQDGYSDLAAPSMIGSAKEWQFAYSQPQNSPQKIAFRFSREKVVGRTTYNLSTFPMSAYFTTAPTVKNLPGIVVFSEQLNAWMSFAFTSAGYTQVRYGTNTQYDLALSLSFPQPMGISNFKDGIENEVLWMRNNLSGVYWVRNVFSRVSPETEKYPWATFPSNYQWSKTLLGDFNGDRLTDIVAYGGRFAGWWVALSNGKTGFERSVKIPFPKGIDSAKIRTGDFNGDGIDDLVAFYPDSNSFFIALAQAGVGIAGVVISGGADISVVTSSDGSFKLSKLSKQKYVLTPAKEAFEFIKPTQEVDLNSSGHIRPVNFIGVDLSGSDGVIGRENPFIGNGEGPFVCLGYHAVGNDEAKWGMVADDCPQGYAFFSIDFISDKSFSDKEYLPAVCCRLPADDILEGEVVQVEHECPIDSVVTGQDNFNYLRFQCPDCKKFLRCKKINTTRYQLGMPSQGFDLGTSMSLSTWERRIDPNDIPLALRYGLLRTGYQEWGNQICIGYPYGSLLTARKREKCSGYVFRQLQYKGNLGDPPRGTPVKMFPDCSELENIYDPTSGCRNSK